MRRTVRIFGVLSAMAIAVAVLSCHKSPNEPKVIPPFSNVSAVYVAQGAAGDGSRDNPMGSIQQAVGIAQSTTPTGAVVVASGTYRETVSATRNILIFGSRDPLANWKLSDSPTVITGVANVSSPVNYTLLISNADTAILDHLHIAAQDGRTPGQSSHAIVLDRSWNVQILSCVVSSGTGATGEAGGNGSIGVSGDAGVPIFSWETKNNAGLYPVRGGQGGKGGANPGLGCGRGTTGESGSQGFCVSGDSSGGIGGAPEQNGGVGATGAAGAAGSGGIFTGKVSLFSVPYLFVGTAGDSGRTGTYGCGGGGGGGMPGLCDSYNSWAGGWGGGGGAGAGPGTGGSGGKPGGSSIGILAIGGHLTIANSKISVSHGGDGGIGGTGGLGGKGGTGGYSYNYPGVTYGGNGGDGGRGGDGGGGAGGSSAAIVQYKATIDYDATTQFIIGDAGNGGGPFTGKGQDGLASIIIEAHL